MVLFANANGLLYDGWQAFSFCPSYPSFLNRLRRKVPLPTLLYLHPVSAEFPNPVPPLFFRNTP